MDAELISYLNGDFTNENQHLIALLRTHEVGALATRITAYHTPLVEAYLLNDGISADDLINFFDSHEHGTIVASELFSQLIENYYSKVEASHVYKYEIPLLKDFSITNLSYTGQCKVKCLAEWLERTLTPDSKVVRERVGYAFSRIPNDSVLDKNKTFSLLSLYYPPAEALSKALKIVSSLGSAENAPKHCFYASVKTLDRYLSERRTDEQGAFSRAKELLEVVRAHNLNHINSAVILHYRDVFALLITQDIEFNDDEKAFFKPWYAGIAQTLCKFLEKCTPAKLHFLQMNDLTYDIPGLAAALTRVVEDDMLCRQFSSVLMANLLKSTNHLKESTPKDRCRLIETMEHSLDWPLVIKLSGRVGESNLVSFFGYRDSFGQYLSSKGRRHALDHDLGV